MLRAALLIVEKDLRQRLRDRSILLTALVLPLTMAALIGLALGDANEGFDLDLGIVVTPGADPQSAEAFADWLADRFGDEVRVHEVADADAARLALKAGRLDSAVVFGSGATEGGSLRVLARRERVFHARTTEGLVDRFAAERADTKAQRPGSVRPESPGGDLRMIDFMAASMTILFLNFTILTGVRSLEEERLSGALARLAAAPIHPLSVILGKFAALFATGIVQVALMIMATHWLFGTQWAPWPVLAPLVLASVGMAIGMTSFFIALGGDPQRGSVLASTAIFVLAVIGGQFMPPQGLPDIFETLQRLTPNGQAMLALVDAAAAPDAGLGLVAEALVYTSVVAVAGLAFGMWRAGDALHRAAR